MKKLCRKEYHSAIKYIKNNKNYITKCKTAHLLRNKKFTCFWKEIQIMKNIKTQLSDRIDDNTGNYNIAKCFENKYKDLYNSFNDNDIEK